jgi:hypothetical protein
MVMQQRDQPKDKERNQSPLEEIGVDPAALFMDEDFTEAKANEI